jgi:hypothetical protein
MRPRRSKPPNRWGYRIALALLMPMALAAPLIFPGLVQSIVPAFRASRGEGTHGEFTPQQYGCGRFSCSWTGVFTAEGGRVRLSNVLYNGQISGGGHRDVTIPALDSGDSGTVYPVTGTNDWIVDVLLTAVVIVMAEALVVGAVMARRARDSMADLRPLTPEQRVDLRRRIDQRERRSRRRLDRQRRSSIPDGRGRHTAR